MRQHPSPQVHGVLWAHNTHRLVVKPRRQPPLAASAAGPLAAGPLPQGNIVPGIAPAFAPSHTLRHDEHAHQQIQPQNPPSPSPQKPTRGHGG